jgi:GNAT superfamily N-acetyltransferase
MPATTSACPSRVTAMMTSMTIRLAVPGDAAAIVATSGPIDQTSFATPRTFRALLDRGSPPGTERLVAEVDGAVVAWAPSGLHADGGGWFWIGVDERFRRRGIGTALYDRIEPRLRDLGATRLSTSIADEAGRTFLERRGFVSGNVMSLSSLDLRTAALPDPPATAVPLTDVDLDALCDLYIAAHGDIPSRAPRSPVTPEAFRRDVIENDQVDLDVSAAILEDGAPVAFTLVVANHEAKRAGAQLTGVRRDRRGRGLAFAVKVASLHRSRAAGLETMLVTNDLENEPMLAVNRKLGFQPSVLVEHYDKPL